MEDMIGWVSISSAHDPSAVQHGQPTHSTWFGLHAPAAADLLRERTLIRQEIPQGHLLLLFFRRYKHVVS